jgi:hypothetical protein
MTDLALEGDAQRLVMAGLRPSSSAVATSTTELHLGLLGDLQCIVDLDSEIPNGAFEFGMAEEKLNGPEISCSPIDQRGFRPAK